MPPSPVRVATPPKSAARTPQGCPIGDLFRLLGQSHVLDLLYVFLREPRPRRFVQLQDELGMSPNTLTARLQGLVKAGLLTRTAYNEIPPRVEYTATPKALELGAVFRGLDEWAGHHTLQPVPAITPAR
jgi:DNA-binding HxlR family transcriptional regulator